MQRIGPRTIEVRERQLCINRVPTDAIGVCIWHFADCRVGQPARAALGRPRGYDNKGLLDEYRRPKRAFEVASRHFEQNARRSK